MSNGKIKKKKKLDSVEKYRHRGTDYVGNVHEVVRRTDDKGLVTGITKTSGRVPDTGGVAKPKTTYKKVKIGPFEYRKGTTATNVPKKGRVRDLHSDKLVKRVGTERKAGKHTSFSVFGKDIYNKKKEMDPKKADKRYDKMRGKLMKRKKKQDEE